LVEKDSTGEYHLTEQVEVGVLQNFVGVLGFLLPRHLFFSAMFTVMLVLYPILYPPDFSTHNIVAFIFGGFTVAIFWSETYRAWRLRPLWEVLAFLTRPFRLLLSRVSSGRSRRSSSHIASRLVNSLGTLSRFRLVGRLSHHSSGRLAVFQQTGNRIGIGARGMWVPGRFGRRLCSRGFAWDPVWCSK